VLYLQAAKCTCTAPSVVSPLPDKFRCGPFLTREEFIGALQRDLLLSGMAFDPGPLIAFVDSIWPVREGEQDVARWGRKFIESRVAQSWPKHGERRRTPGA
jgi:hypothetical protein